MNTETVEHLKADINVLILEARQDDPGLANDLLAYVLREIGDVALCLKGFAEPSHWATSVLIAMQSRATAGGWPEPPEHPWETVLSDGDGDLG